jgi:hypothetical protein
MHSNFDVELLVRCVVAYFGGKVKQNQKDDGDQHRRCAVTAER